MDKTNKLRIQNMMILNTYFELNNYAKDIIQIIIYYYYKLSSRIKLKSGAESFMILINDELYSFGNNYFNKLNSRSGAYNYIEFPQKLKSTNIKDIDCCRIYSIMLTKNNKICSRGISELEYLDDKRFNDSLLNVHFLQESSLFDIDFDTPINIKNISCGSMHNIILTHSGEIYSWGSNRDGQLGLDHKNNTLIPQKINLENVKKIKCGEYHCVALTHSGEIFSWGDYRFGQLGLGYDYFVRKPEKINLTNVRDIDCGNYHSVAITYDNIAYVWGRNDSGELGLGHKKNIKMPHKLDWTNIKKIKCFDAGTIIKTLENEIYLCGSHEYSILGLGYSSDIRPPLKLNILNIKKIICAYRHFIYVTYSNKFYEWKSGMKEPRLLKF